MLPRGRRFYRNKNKSQRDYLGHRDGDQGDQSRARAGQHPQGRFLPASWVPPFSGRGCLPGHWVTLTTRRSTREAWRSVPTMTHLVREDFSHPAEPPFCHGDSSLPPHSASLAQEHVSHFLPSMVSDKLPQANSAIAHRWDGWRCGQRLEEMTSGAFKSGTPRPVL